MMLHTKFRGNQPADSGEEDFWGLPYMGMVAIIGHVTSIILMNFYFDVHKSLHTNFG